MGRPKQEIKQLDKNILGKKSEQHLQRHWKVKNLLVWETTLLSSEKGIGRKVVGVQVRQIFLECLNF